MTRPAGAPDWIDLEDVEETVARRLAALDARIDRRLKAQERHIWALWGLALGLLWGILSMD